MSKKKIVLTKEESKLTPFVVRSEVEPGKKYYEYREEIRWDFFYSCAYCTIMEFEGQTIGFSIDHYQPSEKFSDLEHVYGNLMYSCNHCNSRKSDIFPSEKALEDGIRYFRPDQDIHEDHFGLVSDMLTAKTKIGEFTIIVIGLNRGTLKKLRRIRSSIDKTTNHVIEGIKALKKVNTDSIPPRYKVRARETIKSLERVNENLLGDMDTIIREIAKSPLADKEEDSDVKINKQRTLKQLKAIYPDWVNRKKT